MHAGHASGKINQSEYCVCIFPALTRHYDPPFSEFQVHRVGGGGGGGGGGNRPSAWWVLNS